MGPISSPFAPTAAASSAATAEHASISSLDGGFSLDGGSLSAAGGAAATSSSSQHSHHSVGGASTLAVPLNSFDLVHRPSLAGFGNASTTDVSKLPCSSVVEQNGTKLKVEWEDSRSFLSNLRCLLTPPRQQATPTATANGAASASPAPGGGLPVGLAPRAAAVPVPVDAPEVTWIGVSSVGDSSEFKSAAEQAVYESTLRENHCVPVYLDRKTQEGYGAFCKGILWPLLHYEMPTSSNEQVGTMWEDYWTAYQSANQRFADRIVAEMKSPHDVVWIHNHHLFSLPLLIRAKQPRATIGLFIHTPFPSSDVFRSLPSRREILESMMEADLLGFHTFDYARHFLSCIKRVLDLDFETLSGGVLGVRVRGRFVSILISHVGIQSHVFQEAATSDLIRRRVDKLRARYAGKKIIVGLDEVDANKVTTDTAHARNTRNPQ